MGGRRFEERPLKNNYSTTVYKEKTVDKDGKLMKSSFFFLDGVLHRRLRVNRSLNIVYCMKYPERDTVAYPWTDVKKRQKKALRMSEVAKMINRHPRRVYQAFMDDKIPQPARCVGKSGRTYWYMFNEDDVMDIRDYFASIHRGRPRKDKMITTHNVPTREEVRVSLGKAKALYVRNDEGEMVPVWIAEEY